MNLLPLQTSSTTTLGDRKNCYKINSSRRTSQDTIISIEDSLLRLQSFVGLKGISRPNSSAS